MSFGDSLSSRVAEIRQAALDSYARWLRTRSSNDLTLDEARTTVAGYGLPAEIIEEEQTEFERFVSTVGELEQRFAKYYSLNAAELYEVRCRLSGTDTTALGERWAGAQPRYTEQWPVNMVDRVDYAASIVLMLAEPPDMRAQGTWRGAGADSFNDHFLVPFREFAARQVFCGVYLANVAKIFFNSVVCTQRALKSIADSCVAAFRDDGPASPVEALSGASLVADLLGFVLPSPLDDLAGVGAIALDTAASAIEEEEPPEWYVEPSLRPWEVVESTAGLLTSLERKLTDQDDRVYHALTRDVSDYFYSMDFETQPNEPDPPDRVDEGLVVNIEAIYEYGARYLPNAAAQYASARCQLEECSIPDWFGELLFPRSQMEFHSARSGLRPALVWTHDYLAEAGTALVTICNEYHWTDLDNAAEFERFKAELPAPQPVDRPVATAPVHHGPMT
jgi:hypothetical protein